MSPPQDPRPPEETPTLHEPRTHAELDRLWSDPKGLWGQLTAVQNDKIGTRLMLTGFFFLLLGGSFDSVVMRLQLAIPENSLVSPQLYNELFTNHGTVTMFLVILPIFEGFAILVLPFMLGSREMPFPRMGAFGFWTLLFGGLLYYSSTLFAAVPDAGWFAYTPLSGPEFSPDLALDFWVLGLGVAEVGAIAVAFEIIIGVLKMRAPGMTLSRIPLFAWALLVMAFMILFGFTPLIVGSLLLELDRGFGTQFFNPESGGSSLLWQHIFWIFGHPEVYIQSVPAAGIVSMVLPVFARNRIVGYSWVVASLVAIGFLSFGLWAHHMFTVGLSPIILAFFAAASMAIAIPTGAQFFSWLATIWTGRPAWRTPFLFCVGFIVVFLIGGITGVMVASPPFDMQAHDSQFVVAHLHYVLIGGVALPIFAGVYYWFPKFTGRLLSERLGKWNFWLLFVGINVTFFPMHIVGLMGMPRRIYTYDAATGWGVYNLISTIGVVGFIVPGIAVFIWNVVRTLRRGERAGPNPWGADTLEWGVPSPPAQHGWSVLPIVRSRHPLWDQDDLHSGDSQLVRFVHAIGDWPLRWRAGLTVGTADGHPQEVFRVAGPSIWPLITAGGVLIVFAAELFKLRWAILVGVLVCIVGVVAWNWPHPPAMTRDEEAAFERRHGVPVNAGGSVVIARWATAIGMLFVGIAFGTLILSYFYLRLENPQWPPAGVGEHTLAIPAVAASAIVAAGLSMRWGLGRLAAERRKRFIGSLAATIVLAVAGMAAQIAALAGTDFGWTDHSYGSIFYTLSGFVLAVIGGLVIATSMVLYWTVRGLYSSRRHATVANAVRFWTAGVFIWLLGFATVYLGPLLT